MTGRKGQDGPAPRRADQPGQPVAPAGGPGARPPEGPRIGEPYVQRFGDRPDGPIRHVTVRLGAGGVIGASLEDGAITVLLGSDRLLVSLTAAGPGSQFERALNLLRLHMPDLRDRRIGLPMSGGGLQYARRGRSGPGGPGRLPGASG